MNTRFLPALLTVSLALAGCKKPASTTSSASDPKVQGQTVAFPPDSAQLTMLAVEEARPAPVAITRFAGRVVWDDNATTRIYPAFGGRVTALAVDVGDVVETNTTLAALTSPDFGQAQADARRADSDYLLADRTRTRMRELFDHGAAAQKDVEAAEADWARAQNEKERAVSRVKFYGNAADEGLSQTFHLTSPLPGIVVERNVNPGQEVRPDAMLANSDKLSAPLFVVTDPAHVWVLVDVAEQDLSSVRSGQSIRVCSRAFPGEVFSGTIEKVANSLDLATRMIRVRAAIANPNHHLKAEMLVTVELSESQQASVEVPTAAVFLKGEAHFIYRADSPGHFSRQAVRVGPQHDGRIVVLEGLQPGQRVVSDGCLLLEQIREDANQT